MEPPCISDTIVPMKTSILHLINRLNPLVISLLTSPLHFVASAGLMVIRFRGRKSGKQFTTPVGFHEIDDSIIVMVSEAKSRQWWRNYRSSQPIEFCLRGKWHSGHACVLAPTSEEYTYFVNASFRRASFIAKIFSIDFDPASGLSEAQVRQLSDYAQVVRIAPDAQRQ